ncbi:MAG: alanine--tRNA ligase, partial [Candidatus Gribaldobacteria bacterium]|nr:alanine--tRNA ligase [Candidatus Gribaldobacteria bacterium]
KIPKEKLAFTVFDPSIDSGQEGQSILKDEEAGRIWQSLGVSEDRIVYLGRCDNWWGPAGLTGPCGPCSEMFYWTELSSVPTVFDPQDKRWVEIWNDVFMQYNKTADGKFEELSQRNVDTGMGLERITMVLQGKDNVYATELFTPILDKISEISGKPYSGNEKPFRIIADHLKASVFMLADGLVPSNTERGYVLRRLIRRAIRYGKLVGIEKGFVSEVGQVVVGMYRSVYSELKENQNSILSELQKEEDRFLVCLDKGLKEFEKITEQIISGKEVFNLYQTYGFPFEIIEEIAREKGKIISQGEFKKELKKHQELSRTASAGQFKSGLADNSEMTTKYHTATHLLLAALRQVLSGDIQQKGSNITSERIRFDFNFERKLTQEEIKKVEDLVNEQVKMALPISCVEMEIKQALEAGATGVFGHKYPEKVKVYAVGNLSTGSGQVFSKEICAGPHVQNTGNLGRFKIIKEEASSAGIRRVKAVLE